MIKPCKFCFSKYNISLHCLYYVALLSCITDSTVGCNWNAFLLCTYTYTVCISYQGVIESYSEYYQPIMVVDYGSVHRLSIYLWITWIAALQHLPPIYQNLEVTQK